MSTSTSISTSTGVQWTETQHVSLTLWDIENEFQQAQKAYEQWQARNRYAHPLWTRFGIRNKDLTLKRALNLGRQVQTLMENGKQRFGARFEQGDSKCHIVLAAQLLRLQYEVRQPLYDSAFSQAPTTIPYEEIIKTVRSIRRTCLLALREQYARFQSPTPASILPPPRFKVEFCPFANQLRHDRKDPSTSPPVTQRLKANNRSDDREVCLYCHASISVATHSGLPNYKSILITSHMALDPRAATDRATFACKSCYKTFDDAYAFLDHVFQKQIGSERSCLVKASKMWSFNEDLMKSDPSLVEQCLKNCLKRELTRARTQKMMKKKNQVKEGEQEMLPHKSDGGDYV